MVLGETTLLEPETQSPLIMNQGYDRSIDDNIVENTSSAELPDLEILANNISTKYPNNKRLDQIVDSIFNDEQLSEERKKRFLTELGKGNYQRTLRDIKTASFLVLARSNFPISEILFPIITPFCLAYGPQIDNSVLSSLVTTYPIWGQFVLSPHTLALRYPVLTYNLIREVVSHSLTKKRTKQYLVSFGIASFRGVGCLSGFPLLAEDMGIYLLRKQAKDIMSDPVSKIVSVYGAVSTTLGFPVKTEPISFTLNYYIRKGINSIRKPKRVQEPLYV